MVQHKYNQDSDDGLYPHHPPWKGRSKSPNICIGDSQIVVYVGTLSKHVINFFLGTIYFGLSESNSNMIWWYVVLFVIVHSRRACL